MHRICLELEEKKKKIEREARPNLLPNYEYQEMVAIVNSFLWKMDRYQQARTWIHEYEVRVDWIVSEARIMDTRLVESQGGKRKRQRTAQSSDDEAEAREPKTRAPPNVASLPFRGGARLLP